MNGSTSSAYASGSNNPSAGPALNGHAEAGTTSNSLGANEGVGEHEEEEQDGDEHQQTKANGAGPSRHGFESSEETLRELESRYFLYYTDVRSLRSLIWGEHDR